MWIFIAGLLATSAILIDAYNSHGDVLNNEFVSLGVQYQMWHAFGLLILHFLIARDTSRLLSWTGWLLLSGTVLFSASLYGLGIFGHRPFPMSAPIGGTLLIFGWALLTIYGLKVWKLKK